jgi:hypothetical protein
MFADRDCIFRTLRAGGDSRDKPGRAGAGEPVISPLGMNVYIPAMDLMRHASERPFGQAAAPGTLTPQDRFPPIAVIGRCCPHGPVRDIARTGWTTAMGTGAELHASTTLRLLPTQAVGLRRSQLGGMRGLLQCSGNA